MRGEDLLAAVLAEPDELAPRLVYADWLLETGAARGELIQLQCQAEQTIGAAREALLVRADKLLRKHRAEWMAPLAHLVKKAEFRRGFVEWVVLDSARLPGTLEEIVRHEPVRTLTVVGGDGQGIVRLSGSPALGYLKELDLSNGQFGAKLCLMAATGRLDAIKKLWLADNDIGYEGARFLSQKPLPRLEELGLSGCYIDSNAAAQLARADLPRLRRLFLARNPLGDTGAVSLARSATMPALRELDVRQSELGVVGRRALEEWARGGRRLHL